MRVNIKCMFAAAEVTALICCDSDIQRYKLMMVSGVFIICSKRRNKEGQRQYNLHGVF